MPLSDRDHEQFVAYLRNCTDRQVQGCYDKEKAATEWDAGRVEYRRLAEAEAARRGIELDR